MSPTAQQGASVRYIAGGTCLIDLMKLSVETPRILVDINRLPLKEVEREPDGGVRIGAMVRNSDLAHHSLIQEHYPVLSEALLAGASAQLRNMASTGGNLLQRTRCMYFRDTVWACNKRVPGSGCSAIGGSNRTLAILGASEHCIATNPSDMNVALTALEAKIHINGQTGLRVIPISNFFLKPGSTPQRENLLEPGDLITHVALPPPVPGSRSRYLKLRDRASYEFALASAAIVVTVKDQKIAYVRIALGGVGTVPWRAIEAEEMLLGEEPIWENFRRAAESALQHAKAQTQNGFKIELARRCMTHAMSLATLTA
jgi:xanthine dehydrogenase YagS FAD-binding subunit